jgi:hypothetical protein
LRADRKKAETIIGDEALTIATRPMDTASSARRFPLPSRRSKLAAFQGGIR